MYFILGLASFTGRKYLDFPVVPVITSSLPLLGCAHYMGNITCFSVG